MSRYAMWTPLPPQRSGIADYSFELLQPLAGLVDITGVTDGPRQTCASHGVLVIGPAEVPAGTKHIYQLGNHTGAHAWMYRQILREPGVLVLHDSTLLDFYIGLHGGIEAPEFVAEVNHAHGMIRGRHDDPALLNGWPAVELDGVRVLDLGTLTMERRVVEASSAVIVHDPATAKWLRERYRDKPVYVVPSAAPIHEQPSCESARAKHGYSPHEVVFGVFGGLGRIKRILVVLLAFAEVRRHRPDAQLIIAGHPDDPDVTAGIEQAIAQYGLHEAVKLVLSPGKSTFEELICSTDAVVNLRWPTAGETSGVMMRAFGAGKVVITTDLPQHAHYDSEYCLRLPHDPADESAMLIKTMLQIASSPDDVRAAGARARDNARLQSSWSAAADAYREVLEQVGDTRRRPMVNGGASRPRPGVNVLADLRASTGIAEAARRHSLALLDAGASMTYTEFNSRAPYRTAPVPARIAALRGGKDHPVDLWMLNLNEFELVPEESLDRYGIALWAWEMPVVFDETLVQLKRLNELWVVSSFVADAFRTVTDIPITVVPNVVPRIRARADRTRLGLPDDALIVLFSFSAASSDARKNPWGAIEAFRRAFPAAERGRSAHLVIKAVDLADHPEMSQHLAEKVAAVDGLLISQDLAREDMDRLLASCDIYLSLHRSEGFGFGIAEAMSLGKPVIATGHGGNLDFMPPGAGATVGYTIREITDADHRFGPQFAQWYRPGQLWAEPDVNQAARWLRRMADDAGLRRTMGSRGAAAVRRLCSAEAVGATMLRRLAKIDPTHT